jgi:hypothetical protein
MEDACHAGQKNYDHLEVGEWPTRLQRATTKEMEHYKSGNYYWSSVLPYGEGAKLVLWLTCGNAVPTAKTVAPGRFYKISGQIRSGRSTMFFASSLDKSIFLGEILGTTEPGHKAMALNKNPLVIHDFLVFRCQ